MPTPYTPTQNYSSFVLDIANEFDCTISEYPDESERSATSELTDIFEVKDNILYVRSLSAGHRYIDTIKSILKDHQQTDTLHIGRDVRGDDALKKIHDILKIDRNDTSVFWHIEADDDSDFRGVDGLLIDKTSDSLIEFAPARTVREIVVPEGVKNLRKNCFNYNKYVSHLVLPSGIQCVDGLESLPCLESISVNDAADSKFYSCNGALFDRSSGALYFIPPYNCNYPGSDLLLRILASLRRDAMDGKWPGLSHRSFHYSRGDVYLRYNGKFYNQEWHFHFQSFPSRVMLRYEFSDWWNELCSFINISNWYGDFEEQCAECPAKSNCMSVLSSNHEYISHMIEELKGIVIDNYTTDDNGFEFTVDINTPAEEIFNIVRTFFDLAICVKKTHPITEKPRNTHLFTAIELEKTNSGNLQEKLTTSFSGLSEYFPFDYVCWPSLNKGFI